MAGDEIVADRYKTSEGCTRVSLNQRPVMIPRSLDELIAMGDDVEELSKVQLVALIKQFAAKLVEYRDSVNESAGHKLNKTLKCKREELSAAVDGIMRYYTFDIPEHGNSKRTLTTARAILNSIANGHERTDAAHRAGTTRDFLDRWCKEDEQFKAAVLAAESAYETLVIDESILRLAVGGDIKKKSIRYGKDDEYSEEFQYTTPSEKVIIASKKKLSQRSIEVKGSVKHQHEVIGIPKKFEEKLKILGDNMVADEIESDYEIDEDEDGQDRESES